MGRYDRDSVSGILLALLLVTALGAVYPAPGPGGILDPAG